MLNTWVKNVYSLCVEGVVNRAKSYTGGVYQHSNPLTLRVQTPSFTQSLDRFTPSLYTPFFNFLHLLTAHLYTLSTVPTIKKTKENKKGI
jgi:hypothetical protein